MNTVTRLYPDFATASGVVADLKAAGYADDDISLVSSTSEVITEDAGTGAVAGGALGAGVGLLTGLGVMAIPGVGPVVAAGWLAATAAGAVAGSLAGAATGGLIGALTQSGTSEDDAHVYAEHIRRGGSIVSVRVFDTDELRATAILDRAAPLDTDDLAEGYRDTGWRRSDDLPPTAIDGQVRGRPLL